MKNKIKIIKKTFYFFGVFGFFWMLNSGFSFDSWISLFQTILFTLITITLFSRSWLKNVFIVLAMVLLIIMVIFFTLNLIDIANFFGSLGFGILLISSLFYLPELIKHGHI